MKAIVKIKGRELKQFILKNSSDVSKFFREKGIEGKAHLENVFLNYVSNGLVVLLDVNVNSLGFYSWRLEKSIDLELLEVI